MDRELIIRHRLVLLYLGGKPNCFELKPMPSKDLSQLGPAKEYLLKLQSPQIEENPADPREPLNPDRETSERIVQKDRKTELFPVEE